MFVHPRDLGQRQAPTSVCASDKARAANNGPARPAKARARALLFFRRGVIAKPHRCRGRRRGESRAALPHPRAFLEAAARRLFREGAASGVFKPPPRPRANEEDTRTTGPRCVPRRLARASAHTARLYKDARGPYEIHDELRRGRALGTPAGAFGRAGVTTARNRPRAQGPRSRCRAWDGVFAEFSGGVRSFCGNEVLFWRDLYID